MDRQRVHDDDVNQLTDVARSPSGVSTLYEATGGDPSSSPRWHAMTYGGDQEVIAALRSRHVWVPSPCTGGLTAHAFDVQQAFWRCQPAHGRRCESSLLIGESADPEGPEAPGMIVLGPDWRPESMSPDVEEWLRDLPDGNWAAYQLPTAVLAVAGRAARSATGTDDPAEVAAPVLTGQAAVVLHGVLLAATGINGLPSSSNLPTCRIARY
jgi:hypothetical protein